MGARWPFIPEKIDSRLRLIRPLIQRRRQLLEPFRLLRLPAASVSAPIDADTRDWEEVPNESYWGKADLNFILKTRFTVPDHWDPEKIALHLPLGEMGDIFNHPEALVHVDGRPIGSADRYHHTIYLAPEIADGESHDLALLGWTGLSGWPPDPRSKAKLYMGRPGLVEIHPELRSFCHLATATLDTVKILGHDHPESIALIRVLDEAFKLLDTRDPIDEDLYPSVYAALHYLEKSVAAAGPSLDHTLHAIGHAHMDIAYLWPISQIRLKNARTYSNVLRLMDDHPDYLFSHSQPQLYAMAEEDYPEIFARIKERVAEGRWEVMGGTWVEPDMNLPGPEALVQQLVLGRRYFRERFGDVETPVLWLPDTFGFPAQVPQLMRHAGLKWFLSNKLNWNQRNKVPWSTHYWEGLDGTRVLAHVLTTLREVQYLPFATNYKSDLSAAEVLSTVQDPTIPKGITHLPICYGYGDGGGGPTDHLLGLARAYGAMPGMPKLRMSTARETFEAIEEQAKEHPLNVWKGEHYMEGHRGTLTSQGWIKRANRFAERALHEAEALSAMAGLRPDLDEAWRLVCLNQFHDIVTGTSTKEVFDDARKDYERINEIVVKAAHEAAEMLSGPEPAVASTSPIGGPRVIDGPDGEPLYFKRLEPYSVTPLGAAAEPTEPVTLTETDDGVRMENEHLEVEVNRSGQLTQVIEKATGRKALVPGSYGNHLQAFEDHPIGWDAWDIDPAFEDRREIVEGTSEFEIVETGPLRASVRVSYGWCRSRITQTIVLCADSRRIDFETALDWHEQHTLLKAAFPTSITAPYAQFDVQWGHVERSTSRDSSFDAARFEVPAHKWVRLADDDLSVAVLNDCKYGHDVHGGTIRVTLIKSATMPDPTADQGHHEFTYSLFAGSADAREALDHEAYALNSPVRILGEGQAAEIAGKPFVSASDPNVIVETVKPSVKDSEVIVRLFEARGEKASGQLICARDVNGAALVDFHGARIASLEVDGSIIPIELRAFEIQSVLLKQ